MNVIDPCTSSTSGSGPSTVGANNNTPNPPQSVYPSALYYTSASGSGLSIIGTDDNAYNPPQSAHSSALYRSSIISANNNTPQPHHPAASYRLPDPQSLVGSSRNQRPQPLETRQDGASIAPMTMAPVASVLAPITPIITPIIPILAPIAPALALQPMATCVVAPAIKVSPEHQILIASRVKRRILRFFFMEFAMAATEQEKKHIVSLAIAELIPSFFGINVGVRTPVTNNHRQQITMSWTNIFKKLMDLVRNNLTNGYEICPSLDSNSQIPLEDFRRRVASALVNDDHNLLAFMHKHTVNADGVVTMLQEGILAHPFILHTMIRFIWNTELGLSEFLNNPQLQTNPLELIDFAIATVGAATKHALLEQIPHPPVMLPFEPLKGKKTFDTIIDYIHDFDHAQIIIFGRRKTHLIKIGVSQQLATAVLGHL
ncbi:uncharacterized protein EDB91DRAFT_1256470 [Suillus paluster]|uniref:uncharacterized protein n=1 Tax=Suillus paluster TaxID=48578 RepID=UPI001B874E88|nr:uncharacterized protein EDB91DRAFT_1256470 [Suillus paluster]KAG1721547.1 hypothetical protein EDB91DRAFT_1256470 [Suillus paluster]